MFGLTKGELKLRVLGCGDGPAVFNPELTKRGENAVSVDPIYVFDAARIKSWVSETYETVMTQLRKNKSDYVWGVIPSVEQLGSIRMPVMDISLADFEAGRQEGRYIDGGLPSLSFESMQFDTALSSHFLFCIVPICRQSFIFRRFKKCCA